MRMFSLPTLFVVIASASLAQRLEAQEAEPSNAVEDKTEATAVEASDTADAPASPAGHQPTGPTAQPVKAVQPNTQDAAPAGPEPVPVVTITLEEAQQKALATHPAFKNINEVLYQADMGIYQAWTMLLPNLSADASVIRNQREVIVPLPMGEGQAPLEFTLQEYWAQNFGVSANMTLFNPRTIPLIKLAYDSHEKALLTAQIKRNDLLFSVTSAYYQAYSMDEMIRVAEENLAMADEFLSHTQALMTAGQATQIDINRAELQRVEAQKEVDNSRDAKQKALTSLKYLIGVEGPIAVAGPDQVAAVEGDLTTLKARAVSDRVELKEAAVSKVMAERWQKETLTKFLPVFDVTYSWSWASSAGFTDNNANWMLIFGAKWDLFPGGARIVEYKIRKSDERTVDNTIEQINRDIQQQVELNYIDVTQRKRNVEVADQQVALAEQNHDMVTKQFRAGLITSLDVINAANQLSSQRIMRVYDRLQYDLAMLTLKKSLGEYHSLARETRKAPLSLD